MFFALFFFLFVFFFGAGYFIIIFYCFIILNRKKTFYTVHNCLKFYVILCVCYIYWPMFLLFNLYMGVFCYNTFIEWRFYNMYVYVCVYTYIYMYVCVYMHTIILWYNFLCLNVFMEIIVYCMQPYVRVVHLIIRLFFWL